MGISPVVLDIFMTGTRPNCVKNKTISLFFGFVQFQKKFPYVVLMALSSITSLLFIVSTPFGSALSWKVLVFPQQNR